VFKMGKFEEVFGWYGFFAILGAYAGVLESLLRDKRVLRANAVGHMLTPDEILEAA
jgi:hypothetical protein